MSVDEKIDTLLIRIEESNKIKKADSLVIKIVGAVMTIFTGFLVVNQMQMNTQLSDLRNTKADKKVVAQCLTASSYGAISSVRAEVILNYVDWMANHYNVRDEELRISERGKVDKSLSGMVQMITTRSGK